LGKAGYQPTGATGSGWMQPIGGIFFSFKSIFEFYLFVKILEIRLNFQTL
jgi:hypothetical protein